MKRFLLLLVILLPLTVYSATYAVIVGIDQYDGTVADLNACEKDATLYYEHLKKDNPDGEIIILTNGDATKQRILTALQIFKKAKKDDTIIFYFSGHGSEYMFCPSNINKGLMALWFAEVKSALMNSKAKTKLCIADSCFSGGIVDKNSGGSKGSFTKDDNIIFFMSSRDFEQSIELGILNSGLFTFYLVRGLKGKADANNDGNITAAELYVYVKENVKHLSKGTQNPTMIGKFDKDLVLATY